MGKEKVEVTTRVKLPEGELTGYLEGERANICLIFRKIYSIMIGDDYRERFKNDSELKKWASKEFNLPTRVTNTMIYSVKGLIKRTTETKKFLVQKMTRELGTLNRKINRIQSQVDRLKDKARNNIITKEELEQLRSKKKRLAALKNKGNRKKQIIKNIKKQLKEGKLFRVCFGSRKRFKGQYYLKENGYKSHEEWHADFVFHRDHSISFLGSAAETSGNLLSTLFYNNENGTFNLRLRKLDPALRKNDRYLWIRNLRIPYLGEKLKEIIAKRNSKPLYHRYVWTKRGCYLHISFELDCPETKAEGYSGQCGLDYNDGFIELCSSDLKGNLTYQEHIELPCHGTGNRARTEMEQKINRIVDLCRQNNWEIIAEDLDFGKTKAGTFKAKSSKGKRYNRMVHLFDYARYKECLKRTAEKKGIKLSLINPAYTSINGLKKFGEEKKLNRHQAAAYYISRNRFEQK